MLCGKERQMYSVLKWKRSWDRLIQYAKSHIWVALTGSMILLFLGLAVILQNYLKNEYFDYLIAETWKSEQTVLSVSSRNLNGLLSDALHVGSEAAINKKLYNVVKNAAENGDSSSIQSQMDLTSELTSFSYYAGDIAAVSIVTEDGLLKEYGRYWTGSGYTNFWIGENLQVLEELYSDVMERLEEDMVGRYCISTKPAFHTGLTDMTLIHIALPLVGGNTSFDNVSQVIVFSFRLDSIVQSSGLVDDSRQDYMYGYLTDRDGIIIYHTDTQYIGMPEGEYLRETSAMELHQSLDYFGWNAHILIDTDDMRNDVNLMYRKGLIFYIILLMFCGIFWQLLVRGILAPITSIREAMEEIRAGKLNQKIEIRGSHELWQLAMEYNDMVDTLYQQKQETQRSFAEKMQSIEQRNQAEREALESQINAHFICNTLNAINYNVMEAGNDEVSGLLKSLANILHYTFSRKTEYVTLGQELEWVKQYLYLQKYRLMDRFEYEINFPSEYDEWPCCKLFLQPFVENSIMHGFENIEQGGLIRITGYVEEDRFVIRIWDNGCGIRPEISQTLQSALEKGKTLKLAGSGSGIGIQNVVTRMRMYFGERFEVQMETAEGKGTCFTFWLPIPETNREEDSI